VGAVCAGCNSQGHAVCARLHRASIYAASRLSGRNILLVFMAARDDRRDHVSPEANDHWRRMDRAFSARKLLAINMFILYIAALGIMLDKSANRWLRFWALGVAPLAFFIMLMTKSATTTVMLIGATGAMLGHAFLAAGGQDPTPASSDCSGRDRSAACGHVDAVRFYELRRWQFRD